MFAPAPPPDLPELWRLESSLSSQTRNEFPELELPELPSQNGGGTPLTVLSTKLREAEKSVAELARTEGRTDAPDLGPDKRRLEAWLAQLVRIGEAVAVDADIGPALWDFVASFAQVLPAGEMVVAMISAVADVAFRIASGPALSVGHGNNSVIAFVGALAALSNRLEEQPTASMLTGVALANGFAFFIRLFVRIQSMITPPNLKSADLWLRKALAAGSTEVGTECLAFVERAEATGHMAYLNIAWRFLKTLCLDPGCTAPVVHTVLQRSIQAAGSHLKTVAVNCSGDPSQAPDASAAHDQLAAFHCSNFLRISRESPQLPKSDFPLRAVAAALVPAAAELWGEAAETPPGPVCAVQRARDLLNKVLSLSLQRWSSPARELASNVGDDVSTARAGASSEVEPLLQHPQVANLVFVPSVMVLVLSGRSGEALPLRTEALLRVALDAVESGTMRGQWRPSTFIVESVAALVAAGSPGVRSRLMQWASSPQPERYCLALRVHQKLPRWMGVDGALAWAQLSADAVWKGREPAHGRGHGQVASCMAVLLSQCEPARAIEWVKHMFASAEADVKHDKDSISRKIFLSSLARRLGAAAAGGAPAAIAAARSVPLDTPREKAEPGALRLSKSRPRELRILAAMLRAGICTDGLEDIGERMRSIMGSSRMPLKTRIEAWATHAEVCLRLGSERAFRISVRYAVRHLSAAEHAGARVAHVLSRAPCAMLSGNSPMLLKGLYSVEWPLRVSGLAAAAALTARASGAKQHDGLEAGTSSGNRVTVPEEMAACARCAMVAFAEELPQEPLGQSKLAHRRRAHAQVADCCVEANTLSWPGVRVAKRRRLLRDLLEAFPKDSTGRDSLCDSQGGDVRELAVAAKSCLEAWLGVVQDGQAGTSAGESAA